MHADAVAVVCRVLLVIAGPLSAFSLQDQPGGDSSSSTVPALEMNAAEPAAPRLAPDGATDAQHHLSGEPAGSGHARTPDQIYRLWVLVPPLVAIVLALVTRQVIPSLVVAILVGAYMVLFAPPAEIAGCFAETTGIIRGLRLAVEHYLIASIGDREHVSIVLFTLLIGATVGVMSANGGTRAMVQSVSHWANNRRRGQLLGWLAGLLVFFDDYANSMIVGPTMRPIYDKLGISRQKLAYIVDSTAAPVASLALIGTWIGAEIGYIQVGLDDLGDRLPDFLAGSSAYQAFLYSIPYRFYAILALWMVFVVSFTGRDFGPMKRAERETRLHAATQVAGLEHSPTRPARWWYAGCPIIVLVTLTLGILFITGFSGRDQARMAEMSSLEKLGEILHNADAYGSILYGAITALSVGFLLSLATGALRIPRAVEAALDGMSRMFPAVVVLVLAWTLSKIVQDLQLARVAAYYLGPEGLQFDARSLPLAIFIASALVSFATGTSWGTMGILCPMVVTVSADLVAPLPAEQAAQLFYAAVGSVLAGAVFGDHCSPISDTTVLSATASGCTLESHVWTQLPYALVTAVVAMACGDLLCSRFGQSWWVGLLVGVAVLGIIVLAVGRPSATQPLEPHDTDSSQPTNA